MCGLWLNAACTSAGVLPPTSLPVITPADAQPTPTPQPQATPTARAPLTLRLWLPDALAGLDSVDAGDVLAEQIRGFLQSETSIEVELRVRVAEGPNGILATLRTAAQVAPAAMPDVTLIRYSDFLTAVQLGLLVPFDPASINVSTDDFDASVGGMGLVDGQWFGVAATLELLHVAFPTAQMDTFSPQFDEFLTREIPLLFPAASLAGLSPVFWLQYMASADDTASEGSPDTAALREILRFYEQAVAAELIPAAVLEYDHPEGYPNPLDAATAAVVTSSMYLQMTGEGAALSPGYVPTETGLPITVLDGWLWVITSTNSEAQAAALRFLSWMLAPERQLAYHRAIQMLPALQVAQRQLDADYAAAVQAMLANAVVISAERLDSRTARALQSAFVSVISGQQTAAAALAEFSAQEGP
jgi:ABC-type glycerol-3-phosphate transport system substrate-binding protein